MSVLTLDTDALYDCALGLSAFGALTPISRPGGQGRVYLPECVPASFGHQAIVVKLYRVPPAQRAAHILAEMVSWSKALEPAQRVELEKIAAWPLATVSAGRMLLGIAMSDVRQRFDALFTMPSGRRERVLVGLEHLLGGDDYLRQRGLDVTLDTTLRLRVAERISAALALLHRHAIVASDIAPSNVLVSFAGTTPAVCFIDCDSMVFRGRQALAAVETSDWNMPAEFDERPLTRAADAYKLGLVILRLLARAHADRQLEPDVDHLPTALRPLLTRALSDDARNRPPAGEWARALRTALDDPQLARHRAGPPPAPRPRPSQPQNALDSRARPRTPLMLPPRARRGAPHHRTSELVRSMLIIAALLLCAFVLIRVFTLAASNGATGASGSPVPPNYYFQRQQQPPQQLGGVQGDPGAANAPNGP